ncbi:hypothetical protein BJP34_10770 [Moorena producens PAL-8-15-08-1]|uniref:Beta-xylanase n=1 Tax=Moorena producens PAL-8-15-08-1 TaxID=1458985 RepID=A0A1D8TQG0_9CYAN|nr:endo-1,4-beta-xylanase [Moorena producens]AOW99869.1 hypothetical protein BJP34_10770 [Moorena producens PAL-8-15-08-1]
MNTNNSNLRSLAQKRKLAIGTGVSMEPLRNDPSYREVLMREYNIVTPTYIMKFEALQPQRHQYNFEAADNFVAIAKANQMQVRGHNLVWHHSVPWWLTHGQWTQEELIHILRQHIHTVVGHYRGQLAAWDVVNEAVADQDSAGQRKRDTIWSLGIGPEYVELAFRWAHEADPTVPLFYNDYAGEGLGAKSDAIYAMVKQLRQRDVPIHGIGFQMHISIQNPPKPEDIAANMKRLGELGLQVQVTEMDVKIHDGSGTQEERVAAQTQVYRDILQVCLEAPNCTAFLTWEFADHHSWIPDFFGKPDSPLPFDESYRPKAAYHGMVEVLKIDS